VWTLENQTPFAVERSWVRDKQGALVWVLAIKGTFTISATEELSLSEEQIPVTVHPEYVDEQCHELRYDTDLPEYKQATDVILNGTAYSPSGHPMKQWEVSLRVGPIDKTLLISGDRVWKEKWLAGLYLGEPKAIASLPLSYRYAFGDENRNPIGCGYAPDKTALVDQPAPNIEYASSPIKGWKDKPEPASFGAVPGHWQERADFAGTHDPAWEETRKPLVPEDFDPRFFQCAPKDQQVPGFLNGGEVVELTHLTPAKKLRFHLPEASFELLTLFTDGAEEKHETQLHTVIIEPDESRVVLVWHSHLSCHHRADLLEKTQIQLKAQSFSLTEERSAYE
jgi:hypothetical protein